MAWKKVGTGETIEIFPFLVQKMNISLSQNMHFFLIIYITLDTQLFYIPVRNLKKSWEAILYDTWIFVTQVTRIDYLTVAKSKFLLINFKIWKINIWKN